MYIDRWDKYEKEKDDLTIAIIIQELKEHYSGGVLAMFFLSPLLMGPCLYYILYLFSLIPFYLLWKHFNLQPPIYSAVKNRTFVITTDVVVQKIPFSFSKNNRLVFEKSGTCEIHPNSRFYEWSLFYPLTGEQLFESTSVGDEFYLVSVGKQKNLLMYSKKHFELKE